MYRNAVASRRESLETRDMRTRLGLVASLLAIGSACGGGGDGDAAVDTGPRCDPAAPFGAPVLVGGINSDDDDVSARLTSDELVVFFAHGTGGKYDLWTASRASSAEPFGSPTLVTTANSVYDDEWPSPSADGLALVFESDRPTPGTFHILATRRDSLTSPFAPPVMMAGLDANDLTPFVVASGRTVYFASKARPGLGADDLYRAELDASGAAMNPTAVTGLVNTSDDEDQPAVTADELHIYYRHATPTESDIYVSSRPTASDLFSPPVPVAGLAEPGIHEGMDWISPDGCNLYFHSDAPTDMMTGPKLFNIYMASR